jgi:hypothetical protein
MNKKSLNYFFIFYFNLFQFNLFQFNLFQFISIHYFLDCDFDLEFDLLE